MKRRTAGYVASVCVAGLVAGTPAAAMASPSTPEAVAPGTATVQSDGTWSASENMNVDLYGPPTFVDEPVQALYGPPVSPIEVRDEPVQLLYGPPAVLDMLDNPMKVSATDQAVKASRIASKAKTFKKAIKVKKAKGPVSFKRVKKKSSAELAVNKKTGAITIARAAKAGDYSIRVRITADGTSKYRAAAKTVTVVVHVK